MADPDRVPPGPLDRGDPHVLLKTVRDGVFTGAVGIASGVAIFIMTWEQDLSVLKFVMILLLVALFTSGFDYIRDVIDGTEHHLRAPQIITRLFLVATFELFVIALHAVLTSDWGSLFQEIGTAVLGITLAKEVGAVWNMVTMALLWVCVGATLGGGLAGAIGGMAAGRRSSGADRAKDEAQGPLVGLLVGAVAAPLLVFAYVVAARLAVEFGWMVSKPAEWVATIRHLNNGIPWNAVTAALKIALASMAQIGAWFSNNAWGPILALLILFVVIVGVVNTWKEERNLYFYSILAAPVVVLGAPLVGHSMFEDIKKVGMLLLLVAIVWGIPGLLLGTALPFLRRPSEYPKTWAITAWVAAGFLIAFTVLIQVKWVLLFAAALVGTGLFFWRGASVEDYWPLIALCVAVVVLGVTQIVQRANFFNIQELSRALVSEPLSTFAAPDTRFDPLLARLMLKHQSDLLQPPVWKSPSDLLQLRDLRVLPLGCARYGVGTTAWLKCYGFLHDDRTAAQRMEEKVRELRSWVSAVWREEGSSQKLETIARQAAAALREQAVRDEALATAPGGQGRTLMKETAAAQSATRSLLTGSSDLPKSISSKLERLTALSSGRPYASLGSLLDPGLPADLDAEVTRTVGQLTATIRTLTDRKTETSEAIHVLETAGTHLESRLARLRQELAHVFELCLNGSLGFWITLGLLAGWSRQNREPHA